MKSGTDLVAQARRSEEEVAGVHAPLPQQNAAEGLERN
jgi:hypothetical protein